jgi:hypothetical protein
MLVFTLALDGRPVIRGTHHPAWTPPAGKNTDITVDSNWNVMANCDARVGKWRGNWRMEWVASTLHTTSEHGVSSITTADAHTSAASSRLNWRPPADLNGLVHFARKTKSGFCARAITFQLASTALSGNIVLYIVLCKEKSFPCLCY